MRQAAVNFQGDSLEDVFYPIVEEFSIAPTEAVSMSLRLPPVPLSRRGLYS